MKVKREKITIKSYDGGRTFIIEEKRFPGAVYQYVMIPKFKEDRKLEIVFEPRFSGRLWPVYAIGMIIFYGLKALPTLIKLAACRIAGHSPIEETVTIKDEKGRTVWSGKRVVCKRCHEEIKVTGEIKSQHGDRQN